jgi:nucleoside-diphosphate-sugar epimerase
VARGTAALVETLLDGASELPPLQLVSGVPTRLDELAHLAQRLGGKARYLEEASMARTVTRFWGSPGRARALLGWQAEIDLEAGLCRMIQEFAAAAVGDVLVA